MKISLALGNREAITSQTARGCAATNLALPGFGSILAGRAVGYAQAALTVAGFAMTLVFGLRFMVWFLAHRSEIMSPQADPIDTLLGVWLAVRWAVLGMALFLASWLWALATNALILRSAPKNADAGKPPKLK